MLPWNFLCGYFLWRCQSYIHTQTEDICGSSMLYWYNMSFLFIMSLSLLKVLRKRWGVIDKLGETPLTHFTFTFQIFADSDQKKKKKDYSTRDVWIGFSVFEMMSDETSLSLSQHEVWTQIFVLYGLMVFDCFFYESWWVM